MFVRASKRTLYRYVCKQQPSSLKLLHLPFLCPALYEQPNGARKNSTSVQVTSLKPHLGLSTSRSGRHPAFKTPSHRRRLASAAAALQYEPENDAYLPWAEPSVSNFSNQPSFNEGGISALRHFNPKTSLLVLRDSVVTYPKVFRAKDHVTGDLNQIHESLHACLQVGRLERAAALVRRLNQIYNPDAPGLLAAHSDYVREVTNKIVETKDQRLLQDLQRWFEVDLKRAAVIPNAEIYAHMIRASSQLSDASRGRAMRRYQKLAKDAGLGVETSALWESNLEDFLPVRRCLFLQKFIANRSPGHGFALPRNGVCKND